MVLFHKVVNTSGYRASSVRCTLYWWLGEHLTVISCEPVRHFPRIRREVLRKTVKSDSEYPNISTDIWATHKPYNLSQIEHCFAAIPLPWSWILSFIRNDSIFLRNQATSQSTWRTETNTNKSYTFAISITSCPEMKPVSSKCRNTDNIHSRDVWH